MPVEVDAGGGGGGLKDGGLVGRHQELGAVLQQVPVEQLEGELGWNGEIIGQDKYFD
jgi:hypothetical protein